MNKEQKLYYYKGFGACAKIIIIFAIGFYLGKSQATFDINNLIAGANNQETAEVWVDAVDPKEIEEGL